MKQSQRLRGSDLEEEQAVRSVIQVYFDSMSESSREKVCKAFHPSGKVTGYLEDGLHEMTSFANFCLEIGIMRVFLA